MARFLVGLYSANPPTVQFSRASGIAVKGDFYGDLLVALKTENVTAVTFESVVTITAEAGVKGNLVNWVVTFGTLKNTLVVSISLFF